MDRRRLAVLAAAFFAARLLLVLGAADRLSQPDAAEIKLMAIGDEWVQTGPPSLDRILWHVRAGTNAPHGAYLPVSLGYAALVVPFGADGSYLALKLVAILLATLGFVAWTSTAFRLAGPTSAAVMAGLLFLPPPGFLAGSLVAWGSHPESATLVGLAAWVLTSGRIHAIGDALAAGLLVGGVVGCNLLVGPLVGAMAAGWAWDRWHSDGTRAGGVIAALAVGAAAALGAFLWLTGGLSASVTETAGSSPLELLTGPDTGAEGVLGATVAGLLPLSLWPIGVEDAGTERMLNLGWTALGAAGLAAAVAGLLRREDLWGRGAALLLVGPIAHLATVVLLAPRRPDLPPRYLLVLTPVALLAFALAIGWAADRPALRRAAGAAAALWLVPCVIGQATLLGPGRMGGFTEYRPGPWLAADIGRVTYTEAPWVNRFVEGRGTGQAYGFGFAAGVGAADDPFEADRDPLDPQALMVRRTTWLEAPHTDAERRTLHENIGWSLSVFAWERTG
ncbi:MAG: hypothetical protein AB8A39_02900, partial [Prochlorococcus sp.]